MNDLIHYLAREYPTATSFEIGKALETQSSIVRRSLGRTFAWDSEELARRPNGEMCSDPKFVAIMKRRVNVEQEEAA